MNTSKLKTFAQKSRTILMEGVARKAFYWGFDKKGNVTDEPVRIEGGMIVRETVVDDPTLSAKWQALRNAIRNKSFEEVVEEAAYTWFNRLMAMIILSKNGYDQPQLEYGEGQMRVPMIQQRARRGQAGFLTSREQQRLQPILNDYQRETDAFGILILGYCHQHPLLNSVFGRVDDYTELLLPVDILSPTGFIHLLNTTDAITADDYKQVELIGWLYQFYISEKKDEVFAAFKQNKKAEAKDIPAATQIFTPNWIVKYMVQNTVGRIWLDLHPESELRARMKYLVDVDSSQSAVASSQEVRLPATGYRLPTKENHSDNSPIITEVAQLKLLDPACGSGHILVEGFDLLYDMYREEFYPNKEAVHSILKNNLFGLDIDRRAVQLTQFAILMKAAQRYPDILKEGILPQVYAMPEPVDFSREEIREFLGNEGFQYIDKLTAALLLMKKAQNLGSIMQFELDVETRYCILNRLNYLQNKSQLNFHEESILHSIQVYIDVLLTLTNHYEAVAANPPYMHRKNMNVYLKDYVFAKYPKSNTDLFAVFIERSFNFLVENGLVGSINQQSWMFISSYEELRKDILKISKIESLLHLGLGVFKELNTKVVQSVAYVLRKGKKKDSPSIFYNLKKGKDLQEKEKLFIKKLNRYIQNQQDLLKIPGCTIAYWLNKSGYQIFDHSKINDHAVIFQGMITGDNSRFVRFWHEIDSEKFSQNNVTYMKGNYREKYWCPYNKGGESVKWYGNQEYVVNFKEEGLNFTRGKYQFKNFFFKEYVTWSYISLSLVSRYFPHGFLWDVAGSGLFPNNSRNIYLFTSLLTSKVGNFILEILNPTLNYQVENIASVPLIIPNDSLIDKISSLTLNCISITKRHYDFSETSWRFYRISLFNECSSLEKAFLKWHNTLMKDLYLLHAFEEELNRTFIEIYGLQGELSPDVALKDITILQDELDFNELEKLEPRFRELGKDAIELPIKKDEVMRQLISYAIGIFMGRYRLDKPGLNIAHPDPGPEELQPYDYKSRSIHIDDDAIIPLMGNSGQFSDDALHRIKYFLEAEWGEETLVENINFLQACLDEELQSYLVKGFWKDHCHRYKKRPIYWLFASKNNAFQVLVYMHRMNRFTAEKIRSKYLLPHIRHIQGQIVRLEANTASLSGQDARRLDQLRKDLNECQEYDLLLKDKADRQIEFDLDDGVVRNYKLFEGVVAEIK